MTPADRFNEVVLLVMGAALAGPVCVSPLLLLPSPPSVSLFSSNPFLRLCQTGVFVCAAASFHQGTIVSWRAFVMKASVFPPLFLPSVTWISLFSCARCLPLNYLSLCPCQSVSLTVFLRVCFFSNCFFVAALCLGIFCHRRHLCLFFSPTHETTVLDVPSAVFNTGL